MSFVLTLFVFFASNSIVITFEFSVGLSMFNSGACGVSSFSSGGKIISAN